MADEQELPVIVTAERDGPVVWLTLEDGVQYVLSETDPYGLAPRLREELARMVDAGEITITDKAPLPFSLAEILPGAAEAGSADVAVSCWGCSFTENTKIVFDGVELPTEYVSISEVRTTVSPVGRSAGQAQVLLRDGGQETAAKPFTFTISYDALAALQNRIAALEAKQSGI